MNGPLIYHACTVIIHAFILVAAECEQPHKVHQYDYSRRVYHVILELALS